jgi:hypothetical protein
MSSRSSALCWPLCASERLRTFNMHEVRSQIRRVDTRDALTSLTLLLLTLWRCAWAGYVRDAQRCSPVAECQRRTQAAGTGRSRRSLELARPGQLQAIAVNLVRSVMDRRSAERAAVEATQVDQGVELHEGRRERPGGRVESRLGRTLSAGSDPREAAVLFRACTSSVLSQRPVSRRWRSVCR